MLGSHYMKRRDELGRVHTVRVIPKQVPRRSFFAPPEP